MRRIHTILLIVMTLLTFVSCTTSAILFQENKKDWIVKGDANWVYKNKEWVGNIESGFGYLVTNRSYKDFILELEFKPDSTINSGVFIRCTKAEIDPVSCFELNIWDLHPNQDFRTGAVVTKSTPLQHVETINKWNSYKIKIEKGHLKAWVNGILTADIRDESLTEGYIALQAAGIGEIRFKNIKLKVLITGN